MEKTIDFLVELVEEMDDISWTISGIVEFERVVENDRVYAKLENGSAFDEQDNYFIHQVQEYEDCFSGTIIYPITESKALKISYNC